MLSATLRKITWACSFETHRLRAGRLRRHGSSDQTTSQLGVAFERAGCGVVVEPDQPESLANKIREVAAMSSAELVAQGQSGRNFVLANFTREVCLPKIIDVMENAVTEQPDLCTAKTANSPRSL